MRLEPGTATELRGSSREALYGRHAPDALRLGYLLTGDRSLAEDLVQEAFARLFGRVLHLRNPDAFGPYLRRTVVNLSRMHFRHAGVERAYLGRIGLRALDQDHDHDPQVDEREDLWQALLCLPERQRAAIVLHFYEDLPEEQAAEILRCRPGTYRSLISRGIARLRTIVGGDSDAQ